MRRDVNINTRRFVGVRPCLSLHESVVIVEISEDKVRKDIEARRVVPAKNDICSSVSRLSFDWSELLALAVIYHTDDLPAHWRKSVWHDWKTLSVERLNESMPLLNMDMFDVCHIVPCNLNIPIRSSNHLYIDASSVLEKVLPRINLYARGLMRIDENNEILEGTPVFKGTRISVIHVGHMLSYGESIKNLMEDFPEITEGDIEFSRLYYEAHPPIGRPRKDAGSSRHDKLAVG
jgi:uncharacterized protein (DUF433 family)